MKRLLLSILAFLYLSTSMGATIHLHYCMGKLISWGLVDRESENCANCGMHKGKAEGGKIKSGRNCCKDEHKVFKTVTDQKFTSSELQFTKFLTRIDGGPASFGLIVRFSNVTSIVPLGYAPPIPDDRAIFLLNGNFRL